ncbi:MAG: Spx/MgsR family RNA polymerase-binding regulatory protein [Luteimonas sp.]|nr:Spx/MgsR family RNA polymerase-binding regulatory protein [Luteimonas sp.]
MTKLYGIKNCQSSNNARKWLDVADVAYAFVDLREDGVDDAQLQQWLGQHGADKIVNKRSLTWRELDTDTRAACDDDPAAVLKAHPTLIKRPILENGSASIVGFSIVDYEAAHVRAK